MREVKPPQVIRPVPEAATLVFVRPSGFASAIVVTILDTHGKFIGDSLADSHFSITVPPGDYLLIAWAENTSALRATVAANRTYYIEVAPKMGVWSARAHLLAIKQGSENWSEVTTWLRDSRQFAVDARGGQSYIESRRDDVAERIRRANEAWAEYTPEEREARTLRAGDGVTSPRPPAQQPVAQQ